jgi:BirA family biotin operon repressor/biotin-[acetyl-CoA-carboxylase] ligase
MNENNFVEEMRNFSNSLKTNLVKRLIVYDEVSSTNVEGKKLVKAGAEEGTVILARSQKKGRGRFDRIWVSPIGGLYLSIILRPKQHSEKVSLLPLIGALTVSKTINHFGVTSKIKWPNDVRINEKKVAGILAESETDSKKILSVVFGIGVNLNIENEQLPNELKKTATSLSQELKTTVDYQAFLKDLLLNFGEYYSLFKNGNFEKILIEWRKHSDTLDRKVRILSPSGVVEGTAIDIDENGFLIVSNDNYKRKKIFSGDCIYL